MLSQCSQALSPWSSMVSAAKGAQVTFEVPDCLCSARVTCSHRDVCSGELRMEPAACRSHQRQQMWHHGLTPPCPLSSSCELCANSLTSQARGTPSSIPSQPLAKEIAGRVWIQPPEPEWVFQCLMLLIKNWGGEAPTLVWEGAVHPLLQGATEPPLAELSSCP